MPMPRRSTATIGWLRRTSAPARESQTGNCTDDGRSDPVVKTSGPASCGVCTERARTAPMLSVPAAPLTGSRSASKLAQSSLTPGAAGTAASANTRAVQSCHDKSFLGAAMGGGPPGRAVVVTAPCGRAPELVAKRGLAATPGTQPASTMVIEKVTATTTVAGMACRLMPTTVASRHASSSHVAGVEVAGFVGQHVGAAHPGEHLSWARRNAWRLTPDHTRRDRQAQLVEQVMLDERAEQCRTALGQHPVQVTIRELGQYRGLVHAARVIARAIGDVGDPGKALPRLVDGRGTGQHQRR